MRVDVDVSYGERENDRGVPVATTAVTCSRCGAREWAWGTHEGSLKRCLATLRDTCPKAESNYYHTGDAPEDTGAEYPIRVCARCGGAHPSYDVSVTTAEHRLGEGKCLCPYCAAEVPR